MSDRIHRSVDEYDTLCRLEILEVYPGGRDLMATVTLGNQLI